MDNPLTIRPKHLLRRLVVAAGYHSSPDFLIVGAQKAGTSGLFGTLGQHPQLVSPREKEIDFFNDEKMSYGQFKAYHEKFPLPHRLVPGKLTFEASPAYLDHPACPERIFEYSASMRLIALLREPVARAYSAWNMYHGFEHSHGGRHMRIADHRTFDTAISQELSRFGASNAGDDGYAYLRRGLYGVHLSRYLSYFSRDQLLVLDHAEWLRDPAAVLQRTARFLGVRDDFPFRVVRTNVSNYTGAIPSGIRETLADFYRPHNEQLFSLLGERFSW